MFAKYFNDNLYTVAIDKGNRCYSACTIIWAGGVERYILGNATLGFHRLSFSGNEIDVKKMKATLNPVSHKVVDFFREVGFPEILIDKMNQTPPSDLFVIDGYWLDKNNLYQAIEFQPVFRDVVEKQCGARPIRKVDSYDSQFNNERKTWNRCLENIKDANFEIRKKEYSDNFQTLRPKALSKIAQTKWSILGKSLGTTIYFDKLTLKHSDNIVKVWILIDQKDYKDISYKTIDCRKNAIYTEDDGGYRGSCTKQNCSILNLNEDAEPHLVKDNVSINGVTVNAICNL